MRATGILLVMVLIAAAVVLMLRSREAVEAERSVNRITAGVHEEGVKGVEFDRQAAEDVMARLETMAKDQGDLTAAELEEVTRQAAQWAEGAPTPSAELTAAVGIRSAAGELRQLLLDGDGMHRRSARRYLARARRALSGDTARGGVQGVQDRLQNLQQSEKEHLQDLNQALQ